jgi:hypothetical protein
MLFYTHFYTQVNGFFIAYKAESEIFVFEQEEREERRKKSVH